MTVKEMFELPQPQRRRRLVDAVDSYVLGVIPMEDVCYKMASMEDILDGKIPAMTKKQILNTDAVYRVAYEYEDVINTSTKKNEAQ